MENKKIQIGYWDCRGVANSLRLTLIACNLEYDETIYDIVNGRDKWFEEDKKNLDLTMPDLPYFIHGDIKMTEHDAIMRYLAKTYKPDLLGKTIKDQTLVDQYQSFSTKIMTRFPDFVYFGKTKT